jgi:acetyl-CoA C-acetyltransferase
MLLAQVLRGLLGRVGLDGTELDDVVMGNGANVGDHANDIARMAVLAAGLPTSLPGTTVNRFCGSGQQAVNFAAMGVASGWQQAVLAGGVESMSRYEKGYFTQPIDGGNPELRAKHPLVPQGVSADLIATRAGLSRGDLDAYSAQSQQRAAKAMADGRFDRSLVPIVDAEGSLLLGVDEIPRPGTTVETLGALSPVFGDLGAVRPDGESETHDEVCLRLYPEVTRVDHQHHAGSSSALADGAAAVLVTSAEFADTNGLTRRARIVSTATAGVEPILMLNGPTPAINRALRTAGMTVGDVDLWEINEAFASIPLATAAELGLDQDRLNVNGGAIALGHPIGATGAMLIETLLDEMERSDVSVGVVGMCIGAGMGTATVIERC